VEEKEVNKIVVVEQEERNKNIEEDKECKP